jgi:hypothetical protein
MTHDNMIKYKNYENYENYDKIKNKIHGEKSWSFLKKFLRGLQNFLKSFLATLSPAKKGKNTAPTFVAMVRICYFCSKSSQPK